MENETQYVLIAIVGSCFLLNTLATYIVLNTYFEVKERRTYQILFVWLLPYIGAIFAVFISREDYFENRRLKKVGNNSNISESQAVNMASSVNHSGR